MLTFILSLCLYLKYSVQLKTKKDLIKNTQYYEKEANNIQTTLNSIQKLLSLKKSQNKDKEIEMLQSDLEKVERENKLLKKNELTQKMREDLRIKAKNLLVEAEKTSNLNDKAVVLDQAAKIIGSVNKKI